MNVRSHSLSILDMVMPRVDKNIELRRGVPCGRLERYARAIHRGRSERQTPQYANRAEIGTIAESTRRATTRVAPTEN